MRGEGVLRDDSQPRTWPRKRTLGGCKMNGNLANVVCIDVEGDSYDDVIVIDVPESSEQKFRGSSVSGKGKRIKFRGIISIDDDESNKVEYPGIVEEVGGDLDSDKSSSQFSSASDYVHRPVNLGDDECQVVHENDSVFRLSKCRQSFRGKYPFRNRYGLNPESESSSSDSDRSDCEVMEGSFGNKEWEKASLKRKANVHRGKSGLEDHVGPSCLNNETQPNIDVEVERRTEQFSETFSSCNSRNANDENQKFAPFVPTDDGDLGTASLNPEIRCSSVYSGQKVDRESFPSFKSVLKEKVHFSNAGSQFREKFTDPSSKKHVNDCGRNFNDEDQSFQRPSCSFNQELNHRRTYFADKKQQLMGEQLNFQEFDKLFHHSKTVHDDEEASLLKNQRIGKSHHMKTGFMEKEKPISREPVLSNSGSFYETGAECGLAPSRHNVGYVFKKSFSCKSSSPGVLDMSSEKSGQQYAEKPHSGTVSMSNTNAGETLSKQVHPCLAGVKEQVISSAADSQVCNGRDPFHAQSVGIALAVENDIINEREKLKETDEYKRAMEEEWASRQQQLQIQAEEAKRLRKKKRAESMRLLDMERRQKQRLEEIRETQKKDEENMNLKEQLRAEVRKELCKLEATCTDMASLLRALGIHVGGSFPPLSHEVHAAYKRALLKFHPDRASKTDIRQEVEAEEKFKLISRMKEKFLLTSS